MKNIQTGFSHYFEAWGKICFDHAWLILLLFFSTFIGLGFGISYLTVDMSHEAGLRHDDPIRIDYDEFREAFGRDDQIIIALPIADELTLSTLNSIRSLHLALESQVPYVDKVTSLVNARYTYSEDDELLVEALLEDWPDTRWSLSELLTFMKTDPNYKNRLVSEDGQYTALIIELDAYVLEETGFEDDISTRLLTQEESAKAVIKIKELLTNL